MRDDSSRDSDKGRRGNNVVYDAGFSIDAADLCLCGFASVVVMTIALQITMLCLMRDAS
jgi:hypothetical protein